MIISRLIMKTYVAFFFLLVISFLTPAQQNFQNFLNAIAPVSASATRQTMVDSFMQPYKQNLSAPNKETGSATFLYQGTAAYVFVSGDFNNWDTTRMTKLAGTNLFYYVLTCPPNTRVDYKFILPVNNYILDPMNRNVCPGGYGNNSELAMSAYIQPWEIANRTIPHGVVNTVSVYSINLSATYTVYIYLPPGYSASGIKRYPSIYFHDGQEYLNYANGRFILDNLIDSNKIAPAIGVFIQPINRNDEYMGAKRVPYRLFIVNELVKYVDSLYNTIRSPKSRTVIGTSLGGNIATLIAYNHPDVFGNCGIHSSAFWVNNYEALNLVKSGVKKDIDFYAVWGTYEETYQWMRPFRDTLISKGYRFGSAEYPEGHSWGLWRATLDDMLKYLITIVANYNEIPKPALEYYFYPNYPNPFNNSTMLGYNLRRENSVNIALFDVTGRLVKVLENQYQKEGYHNFSLRADNLASGTYFVKLAVDDKLLVRKIVLLK